MAMFRSYRTKLQAALLLLGLTALTVAGWQASKVATESLRVATFERLNAIRETRARQIEQYFTNLGNNILALSADESTLRAAEQLYAIQPRLSGADPAALRRQYDAVFQDLKSLEPDLGQRVDEWFPTDPYTQALQQWFIARNPHPAGRRFRLIAAPEAGEYGAIHARYHPTFLRYLAAFGLYDIFLIAPNDGRLVYTVTKEVDFGVRLSEPPYSSTTLASAWRRAMQVPEPEMFIVEDFAPYLPSGLAPASFIATPIYRAGQRIGVLAAQLSIAEVNRIMTGENHWTEEGLGGTGQAYLIGNDGTLRSDVRRELEKPDQFYGELQSAGIDPVVIDRIRRYRTAVLSLRTNRIVEGRNTRLTHDFRGVSVLQSSAPLSIAGLNWNVVAEIEADEALAPVAALRWHMLWQAALLGLGLIAAAHLLGSSVTRPLIQLAAAARRLGRRDFSARIPISSDDEIGQLAGAFNSMAKDLEQTTISKHELDRLLSSLINAVFVIETPRNPTVEDILNGPIRQVNRAGRELLHHNPTPMHFADIVPPDAIEEWKQRLTRFIDKNRLPAEEALLIASDGTSIPVLFSASWLADDVGKSHGLVCVAQDISEWKVTQDKLRRMSKVFMDSIDPIVVADANGCIADCNSEAEEIYGWTLKEMEGRGLSLLFKDPSLLSLLLNHCLAGEALRNIEAVQVNRAGREFPALVTLSLLADDKGGPVGIASISKDITDRKLAEEVLRQKQAELEKLTGRLITAQEEERARLARELHDNVSQSMAALAIDAGRLERMPSDDERRRTMLERIKKRMAALSTELHSLSHRLHPATLADLGLHAAIESECRDFYERTGTPVDLDIAETLPALADDTRLGLYRIVQEALWNITKHARASEVSITLRIQDGQASLRIDDNGQGFDRSSPAWRAGLGVASMEERSRLLGGTFSVYSMPGQGTHIEVKVPVRLAYEETQSVTGG